MSTIEEIDLAVAFIKEKTDNVAILHCVSKYPCPPEDLRLGTICFLRERYGLATGFSDHSITIESAIASVALGATVIEKHFSFNRSYWGSDHKVSLTPAEFLQLVRGIRSIECHAEEREQILQSDLVKQAMSASAKTMDDGESVFRPYFRKTLVAAQDVAEGTIIEPRHLYAMRPQAHLSGLPSQDYSRVLGKRLHQPLVRYQSLTNAHFEPHQMVDAVHDEVV